MIKKWSLWEILILLLVTVILLMALFAVSVNAQELSSPNSTESDGAVSTITNVTTALSSSITIDGNTIKDIMNTANPFSTVSLPQAEIFTFGTTYTIAIDRQTGHIIKPASIQFEESENDLSTTKNSNTAPETQE